MAFDRTRSEGDCALAEERILPIRVPLAAASAPDLRLIGKRRHEADWQQGEGEVWSDFAETAEPVPLAVVMSPKFSTRTDKLMIFAFHSAYAHHFPIGNLLKKVGITAIIVTHDQEEALAIADRVAVMQSGRIAQIGTGGELYHHPNCRFVADFVGYMNYFDGRVSSRADRSADLDIGGTRRIKAQIPANSPARADVIVAVRPEAIRPVADAASVDGEAYNSVTARLIGEEFLGIITNLRFRDEDGRELLVIRSGQDNRVRLRVGEPYLLIWAIDETIVMPAEAA